MKRICLLSLSLVMNVAIAKNYNELLNMIQNAIVNAQTRDSNNNIEQVKITTLGTGLTTIKDKIDEALKKNDITHDQRQELLKLIAKIEAVILNFNYNKQFTKSTGFIFSEQIFDFKKLNDFLLSSTMDTPYLGYLDTTLRMYTLGAQDILNNNFYTAVANLYATDDLDVLPRIPFTSNPTNPQEDIFKFVQNYITLAKNLSKTKTLKRANILKERLMLLENSMSSTIQPLWGKWTSKTTDRSGYLGDFIQHVIENLQQGKPEDSFDPQEALLNLTTTLSQLVQQLNGTPTA